MATAMDAIVSSGPDPGDSGKRLVPNLLVGRIGRRTTTRIVLHCAAGVPLSGVGRNVALAVRMSPTVCLGTDRVHG